MSLDAVPSVRPWAKLTLSELHLLRGFFLCNIHRKDVHKGLGPAVPVILRLFGTEEGEPTIETSQKVLSNLARGYEMKWGWGWARD